MSGMSDVMTHSYFFYLNIYLIGGAMEISLQHVKKKRFGQASMSSPASFHYIVHTGPLNMLYQNLIITEMGRIEISGLFSVLVSGGAGAENTLP